MDEDAGEVAVDWALVAWPVAVACSLLALYQTILEEVFSLVIGSKK